MKILLIKTEGAIPLLVTEKHLEKIRNADKDIRVTTVSSLDKSKK